MTASETFHPFYDKSGKRNHLIICPVFYLDELVRRVIGLAKTIE
ncbi:MAG TPA: hypothetical protein VKV40_13655 [Ktedonobacteraceae bacterium]|nr:hypothetical protein [Ktedonobacteraceae bacterium]